MKKTCMIVLALMMALMVLCAACGGSDDAAPAESENAPEATDLPTVTAPPAGENASGENVVGAEDNAAPDQMTAEEAQASWPEARKKVENELIGASLEELYAAIGEPDRATYGTSCYMAGAEDGILFYDDFYVATTRFNGEEFITGTDSLG